MAAGVSEGASERPVRRELRVVDEREAPRDACLVLLDREGGADFESAAKGAAEGTDLRLRVLTVTAADASTRAIPRGHLVRRGRVVGHDRPRRARRRSTRRSSSSSRSRRSSAFDGAVALADELAASGAAGMAAACLDARGVTISLRSRPLQRARPSRLGPPRLRRHVGAAAAAPDALLRRSRVRCTALRPARRRTAAEELEDQLGDVDWCWRLWLAGRRVLTSGATSVLERPPVETPAPGGSTRRCAVPAPPTPRSGSWPRCSSPTTSPVRSRCRPRSAPPT